jgi:glycerol-3-phosphate cytidylyltransferase
MSKTYVRGMIAGNFDVIHPGYIHMFNECKKHCEKLIVFLHIDPSIERPEKLKPILSLEDRMLVLKSLQQVDYIVPYTTESDLIESMKLLPPQVRFLGDDYIDKPYTGDHLGIPVIYLDRSHGWSTTKFKTLIANTVK